MSSLGKKRSLGCSRDRGIPSQPPTVRALSLLYAPLLCKYIHHGACVCPHHILLRILGTASCSRPHKCSREIFSSCIVQTLTSFDVSPCSYKGEAINDRARTHYSRDQAALSRSPPMNQAGGRRVLIRDHMPVPFKRLQSQWPKR